MDMFKKATKLNKVYIKTSATSSTYVVGPSFLFPSQL